MTNDERMSNEDAPKTDCRGVDRMLPHDQPAGIDCGRRRWCGVDVVGGGWRLGAGRWEEAEYRADFGGRFGVWGSEMLWGERYGDAEYRSVGERGDEVYGCLCWRAPFLPW